MKKKRFCINLQPSSDLPDAICNDGEVESSQGILWLREEYEEEQINHPENTTDAKPFYRIMTEEKDTQCPPGASLLAFHSPLSEKGEKDFIIYRGFDGSIGYRPNNLTGISRTIVSNPRNIGAIIGAYPWKDLVTVVGNAGIGWLLYDSETGYNYLNATPEAPCVDFAFETMQMTRYMPLPDSVPELDVEVDLHDLVDVFDKEALKSWLQTGNGLSVDSIIKQRVFSAVAKSVALYIDDVRNEGLFLSHLACMASFGEALGSHPAMVEPEITEPVAELLNWSIESLTIRMKVGFSLKPQSLSATFSFSQSQNQWVGVFNELILSVGEESEWWISAPGSNKNIPSVISLSSLRPAKPSALGFHFRYKSSAQRKAEIKKFEKFKVCKRISLIQNMAGTILLSGRDISDHEISRVPNDFLPIQPEGAALTDEGVILWSDRTLYTPMIENGVVYRHRDVISDYSIKGVSQLCSKKHAAELSRAPLFIFSDDGLRHLEYDGKGGYRNVKYVTNIPLFRKSAPGFSEIPFQRIVRVESSLAYLSERGIETISSSGTSKGLIRYPECFEPKNVRQLIYDYTSSSFLILTDSLELCVYSQKYESWVNTSDTPVLYSNPLKTINGELWMINQSGNLIRIYAKEEIKEREEGTERYPLETTGHARLLTRSLKFKDPMVRKRITSLRTVTPSTFIIEGSDDLTEWKVLAMGLAPRKGIHSVACRYLRIRLSVEPGSADILRQLIADVQFLP